MYWAQMPYTPVRLARLNNFTTTLDTAIVTRYISQGDTSFNISFPKLRVTDSTGAALAPNVYEFAGRKPTVSSSDTSSYFTYNNAQAYPLYVSLRYHHMTTGDTVTHALHPNDRSVVPLMGDGGSATLLGRVPEGQGFLGFELGTDGTGSQYLIIPAGAARRPICAETAIETTDAEGNTRSPQNLYMNGPAIFHFAISTVPKTVQQLVTKLNLTVQDLDLVLFHQANQYMLDYLVKRLKIPPEKTHFHVAEIGNTSGTSMPVVLREAYCAGKIKPGSLVLMIVFGVGLSWAATVVRWADGENLA